MTGLTMSTRATDDQLATTHTSGTPLTDLQLSYLIGRESDVLGGTGCWLCWEFKRSIWDVKRLEDAWNRLVARHETLRTVFTADTTQKVLNAVPRYRIECLDLRDAIPAVSIEKLNALQQSMFHAQTVPSCWPLFRVSVAMTRSGMRLFVGFDMLVIDVSGIFRLLHELGQLHDSPSMPKSPPGGNVNDVMVAWQERKTAHRQLACAAYWTSRLDHFPKAPELPLNAEGETVMRFRRHEHRLSRENWQAFQRRAAAQGLQRVPCIVTAFAQALALWAATRRFALNLTVGKHLAQSIEQDVMGDFSTNLLLAVDCTSVRSFVDSARALGEQLSSDLAHVDMSGVEVISALSGRMGERLLMPIVFSSFLHRHASFETLGQFVTGLTRTPQVTLDCQIMDDGKGLYMSWDVLDGYYSPGLTEAMFETWVVMVESLATSDSPWEAPLPSHLPASQRARRMEANATHVPWPPQTLHARVLAQALLTPDGVAVIAPDKTLSYREVVLRAAGFAQALRDAGVRRNELVGIVLDKGWCQVVAALGVQMSGAAYLPIDLSTPTTRIATLLELGRCRFAIAPDSVTLVNGIQRIHANGGTVDVLDVGPATPEDLAYVIFTSGSTGTPKGVMIRHRAAANTVRDINHRYAVGPSDRVLGLSSLNFDLSVWDIFGTLSTGAGLVIPVSDSLRDPAYLKVLIETQQVTIWNSVPSYLQILAEDRTDLYRLRSLRFAMLSGDWIPVGLPAQLAVPIISLGGATEASIWSIAYPVADIQLSWKSIPYGKPLANQRIYVLDEHMNDSPDGIAGEIYIAGEGLADGYWCDDVQTAASFLRLRHTEERIYRTGDWGRFRPDGNIEFMGRDDGQVKISGHRVELGEVEAALGRCEGVDAAVAVTFTDDHGQKRLATFYRGSASTAQARLQLQTLLPTYMVPMRFEQLETLPLTANGKMDRKLLTERAALPPQKQTLDRLFAPVGLVSDGPARQAFVAAHGGIRRDLTAHVHISLPSVVMASPGPVWGKSVREFAGMVTFEQLGLLFRELRVTRVDDCLQRAYPTAGSTASVQTYLSVNDLAVSGLAGGLYYYDPLRHALITLAASGLIDPLVHVPANQRMATLAAFTIFFFADLYVVQPLYGEMAEPFAWMESGHMAQLLRQSAISQGLGLCLIGAYDAAPVLDALGLDERYLPLAAMVGGVPAEAEASQAGQTAPAFVARHMAEVSVASLELMGSIAAIWRDILGLASVGPDERFFEIGGTSFSMLAVKRELAARLGKQVSITDLFRHASISQLALHLTGVAVPAVVTIEPRPDGDHPLDSQREMRRALRRSL